MPPSRRPAPSPTGSPTATKHCEPPVATAAGWSPSATETRHIRPAVAGVRPRPRDHLCRPRDRGRSARRKLPDRDRAEARRSRSTGASRPPRPAPRTSVGRPTPRTRLRALPLDVRNLVQGVAQPLADGPSRAPGTDRSRRRRCARADRSTVAHRERVPDPPGHPPGPFRRNAPRTPNDHSPVDGGSALCRLRRAHALRATEGVSARRPRAPRHRTGRRVPRARSHAVRLA